MLRILFTLITVSTVVLSLSAQTTPWPRPVKTFMQKQQPTNKSMATAYRLLATTQLSSDGTGLEFTDSTTYVYRSNSNANVDSTYTYQWMGSSWEPQSLDVTLYNAQGQMVGMKGFYFAGPGWEQDSRGAATYDANNNLLQMVYEEYSGSQWDTTMKFINVYQNNKVVEETMFMDQGSGLEPLTKTLYHYNAQGWQDTVETQMNFGGWMGTDKVTYTYNTNGQVLVQTSFSGDFAGGFEPYERITNTYNNHGDVVMELEESFGGGVWGNYQRTHRQYNGQNQELDWLTEEWDGSGWLEARQGINNYSGNLLDSIVEQQKIGANWENLTSEAYAYDAQGNQTLVKQYEWTNGAWEQIDETRNYYEPYNTTGIGQQPTKLESLRVYPNPVETVATFNFTAEKEGIAALAIYDLAGRQLFAIGAAATTGQNILHWDSSNLPSGSYIYKLKIDGKVASGVLVK